MPRGGETGPAARRPVGRCTPRGPAGSTRSAQLAGHLPRARTRGSRGPGPRAAYPRRAGPRPGRRAALPAAGRLMERLAATRRTAGAAARRLPHQEPAGVRGRLPGHRPAPPAGRPGRRRRDVRARPAERRRSWTPRRSWRACLHLDADRPVAWAVVWTVMVTVAGLARGPGRAGGAGRLGVVPTDAGRLSREMVLLRRPDPFDGQGHPVADLERRRCLLAATAPELGQAAATTGGAGGQEVAGLHDGVAGGVREHLGERPVHVREPVVPDQLVVRRVTPGSRGRGSRRRRGTARARRP